MAKLEVDEEELDRALTELLLAVQDWRDCKARAGEAMVQGFFRMSDARHKSSPALLRASAYEGRQHMLPTLRAILRDDGDLALDEEQGAGDRVVPVRKSVTEELGLRSRKGAAAPADRTKAAEAADQEGARGRQNQRRADGDDDDDVDAGAAAASDEEDEDEAASVAKEPLKWFGVLLPPEVKESRESFRASLDLLCAAASAQARVLRLEVRCRELQARLGL